MRCKECVKRKEKDRRIITTLERFMDAVSHVFIGGGSLFGGAYLIYLVIHPSPVYLLEPGVGVLAGFTTILLSLNLWVGYFNLWSVEE